MLALSRSGVLAGHHLVWSWWSPIAYLWQDTLVALAFAVVDRTLRSTPRLAWTAYAAFVAYVAIGVPVMRVMSTPMTWPMWRAAGGALSDSIWLYATTANLAWIAVIVGVGIVIPYKLSTTEDTEDTEERSARWSAGLKPCATFYSSAALEPVVAQHRRKVAQPFSAAIVIALLIAAVGPAAATRVDTHGLERNAWSALVMSAWPRVSAATAEADWRAPHFAARALARRSAAREGGDEDLTRFRGAAAGRNVILVSLESTAAQYLGLYGAAPDVAPNLSALARSAVVFDHAYAVYPESIKGLFSILCSAYPAIDQAADLVARLPCRSIAAALAARGYRTALFHSGRFVYLGMEAVIGDRGYNVLADAGDIGGHHESSFGVDDKSTVARILEWIDTVPRGGRFFVTYLPIAGHHPYEAAQPGSFPDGDEFGRYRNALRYGDAALGLLMSGLQARGLDRDTLWIVLGDHGEAFGQHDGNFGHTLQVYEENVHVPFVVAAPGLIDRQMRIRRVVSLLDTAPTTLDLVGAAAPESYQGRSALDSQPRLALFFADYSLGLLGLRDGSMKYIHELESGRSRLFDLDRDPLELKNLADHHADEVKWYAAHLRAWSAAQAAHVLNAGRQ